MPRVIVFVAICVAIALMGIEIKHIYAHLKPLSWGEWLPVMEAFRQLSIARMKSSLPLLPYVLAAIMAGVAEGVYWRSRQVWRGYHRSIWQLSGAPLIVAIALFVSWAIALNEQSLWRIWTACVLLAPASFTLSAGYKVSTVRR